jgi:isoquinoline 1-oxidoreductase beta subunit
MAADAPLTRRGLLRASAAIGGGLMVTVTLPRTCRASAAATSSVLTAYVSISSTGQVSIAVPAAEMGQGVFSSLAQIVAEELRCPWESVTPILAGPATAYVNPLVGAQITAASSSVRGYYQALLLAGAVAREMLIAAGAAHLEVAASDCIGANGHVVDQASKRQVNYGKVAAAAALLTPPQNPPLYSDHKKILIGTAVPRPDIPLKVTGKAIYGLDVRVPGMLFGVVRMCPTQGGTVATIGHAPAGVNVINFGRGVAVVMSASPAVTSWDALRASELLHVTWTVPANAKTLGSTAILNQAKTLLKTGTPVSAEANAAYAAALKSAPTKLKFLYTLPYLAHATAEVPCCTASVTATACEIWAPTQAPALAQQAAALAANLPLSAVTVHPVLLGGGLGRKLETDFITYAVMASKTMGAPVKLMWPREQEMAADQYRPMAVVQVSAGLDKNGDLAAFGYRNVSPSILYQRGYISDGQLDNQAMEGAVSLPYNLAAAQIDWVRHPAAIAVGFWRSVGFSINSFAVESAIDEIAAHQKIDPLVFRQTLLAGNTRALNVLNTAAGMAGWSTAPAAGFARGIAYVACFGSLVATIVEITRIAGQISVTNAWCAVDCGMVVNPDTAMQQIEGGMVQGLGAALWGAAPFIAGQAQSVNFLAYQMPRMIDVPVTAIQLIETSGAAIGGLGEVGVPGMAPALANAWFALTGSRLRSLPLFP